MTKRLNYSFILLFCGCFLLSKVNGFSAEPSAEGLAFFEKKIGHCQLFASSSALLFRMLQIPSRVVIGFVGGEYNNIGDFIEVKNCH